MSDVKPEIESMAMRAKERNRGVRDLSLSTGRGGGCRGSFTPTKRGGAEKVLATMKGGGGHKMFRGSFNTGAWKF